MRNKFLSILVSGILVTNVLSFVPCYAKDDIPASPDCFVVEDEDVEPSTDIMDAIDYPYAEYFQPAESSSLNFIDKVVITELNDSVYENPQAMLDAIRLLLVDRAPSIDVFCYVDDEQTYQEAADYIGFNLWEDTSNPKQGDYLRWNMSVDSDSPQFAGGTYGNKKALKFTWANVQYLSNLDQEREIDAKINQLISSSGAIGSKDISNDYFKVSRIYDYELDNFS